MKKVALGLFLIIVSANFFGCATTSPKQETAPTEAPAPVAAPVVDNSAENERLKQQLADQQAALAKAEADKRELEDKLDSALASKKHVVKKAEDSSLK